MTYLVGRGRNELLAGRVQVQVAQDGIRVQLDLVEFVAARCVVEQDLRRSFKCGLDRGELG